MNFWQKLSLWIGLVALLCLACPTECPAPLIWRKGEGWAWEHAGIPTATNPKEQLDVARQLQQQKNYGDAISAFRRLVRRWPTSFAAQDARLGLAECLSATDYHYKAFLEYQQLISKHPNSPHFETALQRQFEIGNLFLAGTKHKVWGVKWFPALDKAIEVFEQVVKNGPYSKTGPLAQFRIGLCYEKQKEYLAAVHAYEKLLERYPQDPIAEEGQFEIGIAYKKESARAEYDQNAANQSIAAFTDFLVRYPKSDKAPLAEQYRAELKLEQGRGLFQIGKFYEKNKNYKAALIYYNEVIEQNAKSIWAAEAQKKIDELTPRLQPTASAK